MLSQISMGPTNAFWLLQHTARPWTTEIDTVEPDRRYPQPSQPKEKQKTGSETILLVEDEDSVRRVIHLMLRRNGYRVLSAPDGDMALALCRQHNGPLHLLVTDLDMPNMGGAELAQQIIQHHPGIKIIYISGDLESAVHSSDESPFCFHFLNKPFRSAALLSKVREVLDT